MADTHAQYRWAAWLGAALLAGFAVVAALTIRDRAHRSGLERVEEPSAVGDSRFVTQATDPQKPLGFFQGRPLLGTRRIKERASRMRKAGMDDEHSFFVYRSTAPEQSKALFLKIAGDEFLEIAP